MKTELLKAGAVVTLERRQFRLLANVKVQEVEATGPDGWVQMPNVPTRETPGPLGVVELRSYDGKIFVGRHDPIMNHCVTRSGKRLPLMSHWRSLSRRRPGKSKQPAPAGDGAHTEKEHDAR